jgi:hypothetical protein
MGLAVGGLFIRTSPCPIALSYFHTPSLSLPHPAVFATIALYADGIYNASPLTKPERHACLHTYAD